jgi:microcompartment protein CcmK/EutM
MMLGRVVGTVVSSSRNDGITGPGYLLIARSDQQGEIKNDFLVALDLVGAGRNELVMISEGSSARETEITFNKPMDAVIVGIVDMIDEYGKTVYRKNIS